MKYLAWIVLCIVLLMCGGCTGQSSQEEETRTPGSYDSVAACLKDSEGGTICYVDLDRLDVDGKMLWQVEKTPSAFVCHYLYGKSKLSRKEFSVTTFRTEPELKKLIQDYPDNYQETEIAGKLVYSLKGVTEGASYFWESEEGLVRLDLSEKDEKLEEDIFLALSFQ